MDKKQLLKDMQSIEFVLFSIKVGNQLHDEEVEQAHIISQNIVKALIESEK